MIQILRAKLHGICVTACDLQYHGSITLDPLFCSLAGIYPLEFVNIWNKNNGTRISTYVLLGEKGSRSCILNGAAARVCQIGDPLIISAVEYVADASEICHRQPRVVTFGSDNIPNEVLSYSVEPSDDWFSLSVTTTI